MMQKILSFFKSEKGQGVLEYVLIIGVVCALAYVVFGSSTTQEEASTAAKHASNDYNAAATQVNNSMSHKSS